MPKYGKKAQESVETAMHKMKEGNLSQGKAIKKSQIQKRQSRLGFLKPEKKVPRYPKKRLDRRIVSVQDIRDNLLLINPKQAIVIGTFRSWKECLINVFLSRKKNENQNLSSKKIEISY